MQTCNLNHSLMALDADEILLLIEALALTPGYSAEALLRRLAELHRASAAASRLEEEADNHHPRWNGWPPELALIGG